MSSSLNSKRFLLAVLLPLFLAMANASPDTDKKAKSAAGQKDGQRSLEDICSGHQKKFDELIKEKKPKEELWREILKPEKEVETEEQKKKRQQNDNEGKKQEEIMHNYVERRMNTIPGHFLCIKMQTEKSGNEKKIVEEDEQQELNYEKEKNEWTQFEFRVRPENQKAEKRKAENQKTEKQKAKKQKAENQKAENQKAENQKAEKQNEWTPYEFRIRPENQWKPVEFRVRADNLFKLIRDKFGISDEQLLRSLSDISPLKNRGGSGGVFYRTNDGKFIVKNLNNDHYEPEKMDEILDKYVQHALNDGTDQSPNDQHGTKISNKSQSMMNTIFMCFEMTVYAKLKEDYEEERKKVIKLYKLQFIVLNNAFEGIDEEKLLKFDIKGTYSPGSSVQNEYKKPHMKNRDQSWQKSLYREYDFIGVSRGADMTYPGFFPEGIFLSDEDYRRLYNSVINDATYFVNNQLFDYSLLLGVQFVDENEKEITDEKGRTKYIKAKCFNCKKPKNENPEDKNTEKEKPENENKGYDLRLYMAIVDIATPFNNRNHEFFLKVSAKYRPQENIKNLYKITPLQRETVTTVPPELFEKRFVATVLGCLFSPESSRENEDKLRVRQSICRSFGEKDKKNIKVLKGTGTSWEMLTSISASLVPLANPNGLTIEKIGKEQFDEIMNGQTNVSSSAYSGIFFNKEYYAAKQSQSSCAKTEMELVEMEGLRQRKHKTVEHTPMELSKNDH